MPGAGRQGCSPPQLALSLVPDSLCLCRWEQTGGRWKGPQFSPQAIPWGAAPVRLAARHRVRMGGALPAETGVRGTRGLGSADTSCDMSRWAWDSEFNPRAAWQWGDTGHNSQPSCLAYSMG